MLFACRGSRSSTAARSRTPTVLTSAASFCTADASPSLGLAPVRLIHSVMHHSVQALVLLLVYMHYRPMQWCNAMWSRQYEHPILIQFHYTKLAMRTSCTPDLPRAWLNKMSRYSEMIGLLGHEFMRTVTHDVMFAPAGSCAAACPPAASFPEAAGLAARALFPQPANLLEPPKAAANTASVWRWEASVFWTLDAPFFAASPSALRFVPPPPCAQTLISYLSL